MYLKLLGLVAILPLLGLSPADAATAIYSYTFEGNIPPVPGGGIPHGVILTWG
jgi:hypothetical protein